MNFEGELMNDVIRYPWLVVLAFGLAAATNAAAQSTQADPLPAWNEGMPKRAIIEFVTRVTTQGGADFVAPSGRIATIDNDGTLWCEQPVYFQAMFVFDRVRQLADTKPELKEKQPYRAILENDRAAMAGFTKLDLAALLATTHSGMTSEEFDRIARNWLDTARHPRFHRLFKECVYQPQLELLAYLKANGFKTFIVSGGGVDFIRGYAEETYGIPPERVVGSSAKTRFELRDGKAELLKLPELNSLDDGAGKPVNIDLHIGRRPILAFGNSDGDLEMLQFTADGPGPRLMLLLHHDDAQREYAYDRESKVGRLDKAWDEAAKRGWTVVSMKDDFKTIFAFEK
jgi:phosphoglycolate phosphatase-like HAD superfamily hydrolase